MATKKGYGNLGTPKAASETMKAMRKTMMMKRTVNMKMMKQNQSKGNKIP